MYDHPLSITGKVSNNAFNLERRPHKSLYIAQLAEGTVVDVRLGTEIVFEDFDDDQNLHTCTGLEKFIKTGFGSFPLEDGTTRHQTPAYIFDNHNHAFAFWCLEKQNGNLKDNALLIHIDQHRDTRTPEKFLSKEDAADPEKVFEYTNTVLNVGNFIPAAQHIGLVEETIFLDSEYSLKEMQEQLLHGKIQGTNLILDIDLDFFAPESDYIGNDLKLSVINKLIPKASVITFATSPYFIDQTRAIEWLRRIEEIAG